MRERFEKIASEPTDPRARYKNTWRHFVELYQGPREKLPKAITVGDVKAVKEFKAAIAEGDHILRSLERGDIEPAVDKLRRMIEINCLILRKPLSRHERAERVTILQECVGDLAELIPPLSRQEREEGAGRRHAEWKREELNWLAEQREADRQSGRFNEAEEPKIPAQNPPVEAEEKSDKAEGAHKGGPSGRFF